MVRGLSLFALLVLVTVASAPALFAGTVPPEPKGPQWVDGTAILQDFAAPYLERATPEHFRPKAVRPKKAVEVGQSDFFWSMDVANNKPIQVEAVLRKISKHSYMYVQDGHTVAEETLAKLAHQFDDVIYPTDRAYFGSESTPGIDGDPRITLLLLDIQDGWQPGRGYVAGYFFPLDQVSTSLFPQSNEREMVYLDIRPGDPTRDDYMGILAHEFQHMIHFNMDRAEPKWINESMAQLAFFVNGYGHAPQIFSYLHDSNSSFERFDNTLEDYGRSYMFMYYVYSKYAGKTDAERQAFTRALVASPLHGSASVAEVLKSIGVTKPLDQIKLDWHLANILSQSKPSNPDWQYDESLQVGVQSAFVYALNGLPQGEAKDTVSPDAVKYISVTTALKYLPDRPTMLDKVKLFADGPGNVVWTVNGGQQPPARLIPAGSTQSEKGVVTPLAQADGKWFVQLGHFARLGVTIQTVEYKVQNAEGVLSETTVMPISSLGSLASTMALKGAGSRLKLTFAGEKPGLIGAKAKFLLKAVLYGADGSTKVEEVALDDKNRGTYECDLAGGSVTFMVNALSGSKKGVAYTYTLETLGGNQLASLVQAGSRLAKVDVSAEELGKDEQVRLAYGELLKAREENVSALAKTLSTDNGAGRKAAELIANAAPAEKQAMGDVLKLALKRARFEALDGGQVTDALRASVLHAQPGRGDDADDSHDNLIYLINKKNENIHNLTHLQIDPQFIEGQLFKLWKLLEIARGFPHLPLPDGLGLADYKEAHVKELLAKWAAEFGVPAGGTVPSAKKAELEQVKNVMRRLILAESLIEFAYNNGLTLAEDVASTSYDLVRLVLASHQTITDIVANFQNVPIVGPIAKALKARILSKVLFLAEKFGSYMASRMKPPYSTYGPIVIVVVANVASRVLHVNIDNDNPGWLKDMGVKLFGKYALTAIPKIGFVARSQPAVDLTHEYASKMTANGTLEEATRKVWDDDRVETSTSVKEVIETQIGARHARNVKEREIASIIKKVAQIVGYASVFDPTNISKVVAIIGGVAAGGLLAHTTWDCGSYFFALPKEMRNGARWAFDPAAAAAMASDGMRRVRVNEAYNQKLLTELEAAYGSYQNAAREAWTAAKTKDAALAAKVDRLLAADARIDLLGSKLETLALSDGSAEEKAAAGARELYTATQTELTRRSTVLADTLARVAGADTASSMAVETGPEAYLKSLKAGLARLTASGQADAAALVSRTKVERKGSQLVLTAVITNLSELDISDVSVRLVSGLDFTVAGGSDTQILRRLPAGEERMLTWKLTLNEPKPLVAALIGVIAEADGVNILPKFQGVE